MRSCFWLASVIAVAFVCVNSADVQAQSGTRGGGAVQTIQNVLPQAAMPDALVTPAPTVQAAPMMSGDPMISSPGMPMQSMTPTTSYAPMQASGSSCGCGASAAPIMASTAYASAPSYGPARIIDTAGPATGCNQLGPLCVPPVLGRPLSCDRPQIGKQYCRPLFGRWAGF